MTQSICIPVQVENGKPGEWICSRCGRGGVDRSPLDNIHRACSAVVDADGKITPAPPKPPPLYKRLANFTVAAIGHVMAGMPTCTDEQVEQRLAICQACPLFKPSKSDPDKGVCTHEQCGCGAGRESKFLNKLAWADQQCPLEKWLTIIQEPTNNVQ